MDNLFDFWKAKVPKYNADFSEIFNNLAKKAGGIESGDKRSIIGKSFETFYELYIYAFFLGVYSDERQPIPDSAKKIDFGYQIFKWGSKNNNSKRDDFVVIQKYIFSALIADSEIDFISLDKGEIDLEDVAKDLIKIMEEYTNGGLTLISDKLKDNPLSFASSTSYLDIIKKFK